MQFSEELKCSNFNSLQYESTHAQNCFYIKKIKKSDSAGKLCGPSYKRQ